MKRTSLKSEKRKEIKFRKKLKGKSLAVALAGGILVSVSPNGVVNATTEISTYASAGPIDTSGALGDLVKGDFVESLLLPNGNAVYVYKTSEFDYNVYGRHDGVDGFITGLRGFSAANGFELKEVENGYMLRFKSYYTGTTSTTIYDFDHNIIKAYVEENIIEDDDGNLRELVYPSIPFQEKLFCKNNPNDIKITEVNFGDFDFKELTVQQYRQGSEEFVISPSELIISDDSITIPSKVLEDLDLELGLNMLKFTFGYKDGRTSNCVTMLAVRYEGGDDAPVVPPVDDNDNSSSEDNTNPPNDVAPPVKDEVVFDKNNPKDLEIPGLDIGDELVDSVIINGEEFNVEYKTSLARASMKPSVYVVDGKLVVPVAVLEYLGLDSESLDIAVNLANGKVLHKVVNLVVTDSSDEDEDGVVPPVDGDSSSNETPNGTSKPNGNSNVSPNAQSNQTLNPNENTTGANTQTKLPNTGAPISTGVVGGIITAVGALLSRKRK